MTQAFSGRGQRGLTLIEMLVTLTLFGVVMLGAMSVVSGQQRIFQRGAFAMEATRNQNYAMGALAQDLRAVGIGVPTGQPGVVYAGSNSFSFNADLVSNVANDPFAVYYDPDAPTGSVTALRLANKITVPGSSPGVAYPGTKDYFGPDGQPSPAELTTYWFTLDTETARGDDYVLRRQVNDAPSELVTRNILAPTGGKPFLSYLYLMVPNKGRRTIDTLPSGWNPVSYLLAGGRSDSLRAVRVNYRVTDGAKGSLERIQSISFTIGLPNLGRALIQQCGDPPAYVGPVSATWDPAQNAVVLSFSASSDEKTGERDVIRYVVYRKLSGAATWGDPLLSVPFGSPSYEYLDQQTAAHASYVYAVAAQDCTPRLSPLVETSTVTVP